jgi:hypothetical protein
MERKSERALRHLPSKIIYISGSRKAATAYPILIIMSGKGRIIN